MIHVKIRDKITSSLLREFGIQTYNGAAVGLAFFISKDAGVTVDGYADSEHYPIIRVQEEDKDRVLRTLHANRMPFEIVEGSYE